VGTVAGLSRGRTAYPA